MFGLPFQRDRRHFCQAELRRIGWNDPLWKLDSRLRAPQPYQRALGSKLGKDAGLQATWSQQWVSYKHSTQQILKGL